MSHGIYANLCPNPGSRAISRAIVPREGYPASLAKQVGLGGLSGSASYPPEMFPATSLGIGAWVREIPRIDIQRMISLGVGYGMYQAMPVLYALVATALAVAAIGTRVMPRDRWDFNPVVADIGLAIALGYFTRKQEKGYY